MALHTASADCHCGLVAHPGLTAYPSRGCCRRRGCSYRSFYPNLPVDRARWRARLMARPPKKKGMGEERAAELIVAIAKRVEANHPDAQPLAILTAAAAALFLGGFTDPKDRHVLHAAERMRERLADTTPPDDGALTTEVREYSANQQAALERARPTWARIRTRAAASVPDSTFNLWLAPLALCGIRDGTLVLHAPGSIRSWCERRYTQLLIECAEAVEAEPPVTAVQFTPWIPASEIQSADQPEQGAPDAE